MAFHLNGARSMGIQNFPAILQPILQQGFLEREFQQSMQSRLGYRACADRQDFAVGIGETLTKTRAGLKPSVTQPVAAAANTNLDNGLTPTGWGVEQYTHDDQPLCGDDGPEHGDEPCGDHGAVPAERVDQRGAGGAEPGRAGAECIVRAVFRGEHAGPGGVGFGGPVVQVDDVRGFTTTFVNGVQSVVGASTTLTVTVGAGVYTLIGTSVDATNVSTTPGGVSGTLTFSSNVSTSDGALGSAVQAANASVIIRPGSRGTTAGLVGTDTLTMSSLLDAVSKLRLNAVPEIDGAYNCYLDPVSARQLFADGDFRQLFQGATSANQVFRQGMVNDFLGLRFVPTTEAYVQAHPTIAGAVVRRPIVVGRGALIEGDFAGMAANDVAPADSIVNVVDGVAMVTREPIDRLQQIIAQSWYWIGGFCAPSDTLTNPSVVPTATNAAFKRAVMIEHLG